MELYETLPIVPLRDVVVFPHMMMPFVIGRPSSTRALEHALLKDKRIFLAAQHDAAVDDPQPADIFTMGCVANIVQSLKLPDGNIKVLVEGVERARAVEWKEDKGFFRVVVKIVPKHKETGVDAEGTMSRVVSLFEQYVKLSNNLHYDAMIAAVRVDDPGKLADTISAHLLVGVDEKQNLLEIISPVERLNRIAGILEAEVDKLQVDRRIQSRVKKQMEKAQKEYYLNEKMKAIQKELGRKDDKGNEVEELKKKIEQAKMPEEVEEKAIQELKRLEAMPPMSAEATVSRNYLDWLIAVPWHKKTKESRDLRRAEEILNEDHYGLEKIKDRILEFLAVRALVKKPKATILTFAGPPGVGKTSLAKSIARAMNRKFVRLSLGGVRDEAEIRGHRRTYIGAFPGQIIQMMKKAGTMNPIFLLDEVDKMSMDFRGDPSAALLEVLDPEQNNAFLDHYLDVEYDLSNVMFICTANVLHTIPQALRDRMEVLQLAGYTEQEKVEIAKRFLGAKAIEGNGLTSRERHHSRRGLSDDHPALHARGRRPQPRTGDQLDLPQGGAQGRRRRRGVQGRDHRRQGHRIPRRAALPSDPRRGEERDRRGHRPGVDRGRRRDPGDRGDAHAGQGAADAHRQARRRHAGVGAGGDELRPVEGRPSSASRRTSTGRPTCTSTSRRAPSRRTARRPGITLASALVSALGRIELRKDVAMTGEITLRGKVLPIGGVKEKVLAAHRAGLKNIILPKDNEKDLADIPKNVLDTLGIYMVETMDDVLKIALARPLASIPAAAAADATVQPAITDDTITH